jgi:hypothetical protein
MDQGPPRWRTITAKKSDPFRFDAIDPVMAGRAPLAHESRGGARWARMGRTGAAMVPPDEAAILDGIAEWQAEAPRLLSEAGRPERKRGHIAGLLLCTLIDINRNRRSPRAATGDRRGPEHAK